MSYNFNHNIKMSSDMLFGSVIFIFFVIGFLSFATTKGYKILPNEISLPNLSEQLLQVNAVEQFENEDENENFDNNCSNCRVNEVVSEKFNNIEIQKERQNAICRDKLGIRLLESPNVVNIPYDDKTLTYHNHDSSSVSFEQPDIVSLNKNDSLLCIEQPELLYDGIWKPSLIDSEQENGSFEKYKWNITHKPRLFQTHCFDKKQMFPEILNQQMYQNVLPQQMHRVCESAMRKYYKDHPDNEIKSATICGNYNINGI